jgi:hypothetical protein
MKRRSRALATTIAALITWAATSTPATAGEIVERFKWLSCPPGTSTVPQLDSVYVDAGASGGFFSLNGRIDTCVQPNIANVYAIAQYTSDGKANGEAFRYLGTGLYSDHGVPVEARRWISTGTHAMCLIADETTRMACFGITWETIDGRVTARSAGPIPVDSPLVSAYASTSLVLYGPSEDGPTCAACPG